MPQVTSETINGLHSCKPGNEPVVGQVKTFTVEQKTSKTGKPWLKIKSAGPDYGGEPYRILSAKPTGFTDARGNISFNIEIEKDLGGGGENTHKPVQAASSPSQNLPARAPQAPPARQNGEDGVQVTREHLMRSANLYILCVNAANKAVAPHMPEIAQTSEQFGAIVGQLFREAYTKRTDDGVNWYSYVDKMPTKPIVK